LREREVEWEPRRWQKFEGELRIFLLKIEDKEILLTKSGIIFQQENFSWKN